MAAPRTAPESSERKPLRFIWPPRQWTGFAEAAGSGFGSIVASGAELVRQVVEGARGDVDRPRGRPLAARRLGRPRDVRGAQAQRGRRGKVAAVRGNHRAISGCKPDRLGGREIHARLGLEVARDLGTEDRVPAQVVAAREVDHEGDVAVRDRRNEEASLQPRKRALYVVPGVEAMPGEHELRERSLVQLLEAEARADAIEHAAVNDIEADEIRASGADLLHRRLVLSPPSVGEGDPVEREAERREERLRFARDAAAPIDHGPEYIEEKRLHRSGLAYLDFNAKRPAGAGRSIDVTRLFGALKDENRGTRALRRRRIGPGQLVALDHGDALLRGAVPVRKAAAGDIERDRIVLVDGVGPERRDRSEHGRLVLIGRSGFAALPGQLHSIRADDLRGKLAVRQEQERAPGPCGERFGLLSVLLEDQRLPRSGADQLG